MRYRGYDILTPLKKRLYDPLEQNITFNKPRLDLEWASLKSTASYDRTLEKKDKNARLCVQGLSVREKETPLNLIQEQTGETAIKRAQCNVL